MMHKAWSSIEEVPYCFSRSSVKFQGHTVLRSSNLTQIGSFGTVTPVWIHRWLWNVTQSFKQQKARCPVVFQGHPSNFKVTRDKTSPILTKIGRFRTIGRSQLSNPSDLPCFDKYHVNVDNFIFGNLYLDSPLHLHMDHINISTPITKTNIWPILPLRTRYISGGNLWPLMFRQ